MPLRGKVIPEGSLDTCSKDVFFEFMVKNIEEISSSDDPDDLKFIRERLSFLGGASIPSETTYSGGSPGYLKMKKEFLQKIENNQVFADSTERIRSFLSKVFYPRYPSMLHINYKNVIPRPHATVYGDSKRVTSASSSYRATEIVYGNPEGMQKIVDFKSYLDQELGRCEQLKSKLKSMFTSKKVHINIAPETSVYIPLDEIKSLVYKSLRENIEYLNSNPSDGVWVDQLKDALAHFIKAKIMHTASLEEIKQNSDVMFGAFKTLVNCDGAKELFDSWGAVIGQKNMGVEMQAMDLNKFQEFFKIRGGVQAVTIGRTDYLGGV